MTIDLDSLVLQSGNHKSIEYGLCVMEAVAYFAGEPHSDHPPCTCPALTRYAMTLNDRMDDANRQKLKPFIPRLVGTRDGNELRRAKILAWAAITEILPVVMRMLKLGEHAERLEKLPVYDWKTAREACNQARAAARAYAYAYAATAAYAADAAYAPYAAGTCAAAYYAADAAYYAADAAYYAADAAYYAADAAYVAANAAADAARAKIYDLALAALDRAIKLEDYTDAQAGREGEG